MVKVTAPHPVHLQAFRGRLLALDLTPLCEIKKDSHGSFFYTIDISYSQAQQIISTNSLYKKNGVRIFKI